MFIEGNMEYSSLYDLIRLIEHGTRLHISVDLFGHFGGVYCNLPNEHTIHSNPVCNMFKEARGGLARCVRCRNYAVRKAVKQKKPFSALCINGVYEYTHPVVVDGRVVAIIFVGNILTEEGRKKLSLSSGGATVRFDTMEQGTSDEECREIAHLVESYILMLSEKSSPERQKEKTVISNVIAYVDANIEYDLRLSDIAALHYYNEVYLGRLFSSEVGMCFKDYVNSQRIKLAKKMLLSDAPVTEIARKVGYNSVTYFNRVFKSHTGKSPTEYRNNKK